MSIEISCNFSFCINCVCQGCKKAVIIWRVVDVENRVLVFIVPDEYLVKIRRTASLHFFNCGIDIIPDLGEDSLEVWVVMITRAVCLVGHVNVLLTEIPSMLIWRMLRLLCCF